MVTPLRILYVDDSALDRDLVRDALEKEQHGFEIIEAASRQAFEECLAQGDYDLVLSDFNILGFEGLQVLDAVHAKNPRTPVIIVTGTGSEEVAVEAMKRGVADYVIKTTKHIQRLPLTIKAVLEKQRLEDIRRQAEEALRESEERYRLLFDNSLDAVLLTTPDGQILAANPAASQLFRQTIEELQQFGRPGLADTSDPQILTALKERERVGQFHGELTLRRRDGTTFPAEVFSVVCEDRNGQKQVNTIIRDITERKRAEENLQSSLDKMRALTAHLQSIREEERTRIAREIHDELGQALTGLKMDLSWIDKRVANTAEAGLREMLTTKTRTMSQLVDTIIHTVRRIATDLRPGVLDNLGLFAALEWQAQDFQRRTDIACLLRTDLKQIPLKPELSTAVFRIFQETLTNIARHAHATKVDVSVSESAGSLILEVRDNGRGITESEIHAKESLGLLGIHERALLLGGEVQISGTPEQGTIVTVQIPLQGART